jgi:hypothetical protein
MAYIDVPPGSVGTPHVHLGEEIVYTLASFGIRQNLERED